MRIVKDYPPNYSLLQAVFPLRPNNLYPWGDILYNPSGLDIPEDIMIHEEVHKRQQEDDPQAWWNKYIQDKRFRLEQELQAYFLQLQWVKERGNNKVYKECLNEMAEQLSTMYSLDITKSNAETLIRNYGKER